MAVRQLSEPHSARAALSWYLSMVDGAREEVTWPGTRSLLDVLTLLLGSFARGCGAVWLFGSQYPLFAPLSF